MQHYLVETIARCTTDLCVVVLQNSSTLKGIIAEWKSKQVTEQRNIVITKDAAEIENFKTELKSTKNGNIINANLSFEYYQKLEKEYEELVTEEKKIQFKRKLEARKTLQQR